MNYVAYYRVSTDRQGQSGLGLEAQRSAVERFTGAKPLHEFTEIESGRKAERPMLNAAISTAKAKQAVLVVAKLDRLAPEKSGASCYEQLHETHYQSIYLKGKKMTKFIAVTTRVNVNGKPDYPFIYCYSNGAPVLFDSALQALEKATALCADRSAAMTDPRAELAA